MVNMQVMDLKTYLTESNTPLAEFAALVDVTPTALYRYVAGHRLPRPEIMDRIALASSGKVQPNDLVKFLASAKEAAAKAAA
jgi:hypothetical protein